VCAASLCCSSQRCQQRHHCTLLLVQVTVVRLQYCFTALLHNYRTTAVAEAASTLSELIAVEPMCAVSAAARRDTNTVAVVTVMMCWCDGVQAYNTGFWSFCCCCCCCCSRYAADSLRGTSSPHALRNTHTQHTCTTATATANQCYSCCCH
jgi:hypothetical protein